MTEHEIALLLIACELTDRTTPNRLGDDPHSDRIQQRSHQILFGAKALAKKHYEIAVQGLHNILGGR